MRNTSTDQTIIGKKVFKAELVKYNAKVKSYKVDNGRFIEKEFRDKILNSNQSITYCYISIHH